MMGALWDFRRDVLVRVDHFMAEVLDRQRTVELRRRFDELFAREARPCDWYMLGEGHCFVGSAQPDRFEWLGQHELRRF
jgi:hypothetical protein